MANRPRERFILAAAAIYAVLALAWIFLSDQLLAMFADIEAIHWLSTAKGVFFVLSTTAVFYFAMHAVPNAGDSKRVNLIDNLSAGMQSRRWPRWLLYAFAVVITLAMLLVRAKIAGSTQGQPLLLILLMLPVTLSALFGGLGPGLTATAMAALGVNFQGIAPLESMRIASNLDLFQWAMLIVNGIVISLFSEALHQAVDKAKMDRRLLDAVISGTSDAVFVKDLQGRYVLANAAAAGFVGKPVAEIIGRDDRALFPQDSAKPLMESDQAIIARAHNQTLEEQLTTLDGKVLTFLVTKGPVFGDGGQVIGLFGISRDVTELMAERQRAQDRLTQFNQQLEAQVAQRSRELLDLYDQAPCGYHSLAPDGTIVRVNQTELNLLGYARDDYVGHPIVEFMTPASVEVFKYQYPRFLQTGHVRDLEFDFVGQDGQILPFLVSGDLIRDAQGQPRETRSTLTDNRERRARDAQIRDLNRLLNEVLERLPFGVVVYDEQRQAVLRNSLFGELLNYPPELLAKEPFCFADSVRFNFDRGDYPGRSFDEVLAGYTQYMIDRKTVCFERRQDDGIYLEVRGMPLSAGWTLLTYTDITSHKRSEHALNEARTTAEAAAAAKSAFLANMSHEIRTPMNAILGLAYLLEQSDLPGEAPDHVRKIRMAGRSLLGIINDILDFSKIESGKLEIEQVPFRLGDVLDNLSTIMSASAGDKELELIIAPPPSKTSQLKGDALRLEQVLINMTNNSIKLSEQGHVALSIDIAAEDDKRVSLRFAVRDTGIGIPLDKQQEIFDLFSQADSSTSRRFGGTGLGLSISRRLVQAMGGELHVTSVPGSGSEFWFVLGFEREPDAWLAAPEMAGLRVLVADDNPIARAALCNMVGALGWAATAVSSGLAAIAHLQLQDGKPLQREVLVLDYQMPGLDGIETARKIRHELKRLEDPIIIMVTAYSSRQRFDHPDSRLADAVLSKPVTSSSLYNAVAHAMRVRQGGQVRSPSRLHQRLTGMRILVVDDSDINREVAQRILAGEGALVSLVNDGQQAVNWLLAHSGEVDAVLMDVQMPVLNGYEATRQIRKLPALARLPVIALTAGAFMEQQELASSAGMNSFVTKPFDVDAVIAILIQLTGWVVPEVQLRKDTAQGLSGPQNLPGLAVERGLTIWRDVPAYQQYLRKFARDYADVAQSLAQLDKPAALALAHKLKGAASNLALEELAAAAANAGQALQQGTDSGRSLQQLQDALDTALASIAQFAPPVATQDTAEPALRDTTQLAAQLVRMLQVCHTDQPSQIRPVLAELDKLLPHEPLQPLHSAIENYDFRGAEAATRAIALSLGLSLEP